MRPGLADDIQQIDDARKTAVIDRKLSRLGIDIACLQETRLADSGSIRETNNSFFWQGRPQDDPKATRRRRRCFANVLCIYAPKLCATPDVRDQFYETRRVSCRQAMSLPSLESFLCMIEVFRAAKVRLTTKKIHRSKTKGLPRINTCRYNDPEGSRRFQTTFSANVDTSSFSATDIDSRWHHYRDAIYISALTAFVKKDR
ncbi:unnamed protein product [Acanthosepion pharaonis]|uniref:Uncharacterized protein n=1 Tax=Acanthosepion pharaonis TaxID=158019 RepID=A0A812DYP4_ACAPH|nr:unnamed protein product [Sepia pharaonis]